MISKTPSLQRHDQPLTSWSHQDMVVADSERLPSSQPSATSRDHVDWLPPMALIPAGNHPAIPHNQEVHMSSFMLSST